MKQVQLKDSDVLKPVFDKAVKVLLSVLEGGKMDGQRFKAASITLGVYSRLKQSEIHEAGLMLAAIRDFSQNKAELRRLVSVSMPEMKLLEK